MATTVERLVAAFHSEGADRVVRDMDRIRGAGDSVAGALRTGIAAGVGFAAAMAGLAGVRSVADGLKDSMIGLNASLQMTEAGFKTMLGSAEAARGMMAELVDFATETPFELRNMSQIGGQFLAMGFQAQQVIPILQAVGNAAAAMGTGEEGIKRISVALAQMQARGTVRADEMRQLTEARIPAWQMLADAIGKTTGETMKLAEEGKIAASVFLTVFEQMARGKWGDAMANQANTWTVASANLREELSLGVAAGLRPFFEMLTEGVVAMRDFVKTDRFDRWVQAVHAGSIIATTAIRAFVENIRPGLESIGGFFDRLADLFGIPQAVAAAESGGRDIGLAFGDAVSAGIEESTAGLDAAQAALKGWDQVLRGISEQSGRLRFGVEDITAAYDAQLAPLQAQLDLLNEQKQLQDILKRGKSRFSRTGEIIKGEDISGDLAAFGVAQQIRDIQKARDAAIQPLQNELKTLERQAFNVNLQKSYWEDIVSALKEANSASQALAGTLAGPGGIVEALSGGAGATADVEAVWKAKAEEIGRQLADPAFWKAKGEQLWTNLKEGFDAKAEQIKLDIVSRLPDSVEAGKTLGMQLVGGIAEGIAEQFRKDPGGTAGRIAGGMIGAGIGGMIGGPVGAAIGGVLGSEIGRWAGQTLWESDKFWASVYDIKKFMSGLSFDLDGKTTWEKFQTSFHAELTAQSERIGASGQEMLRSFTRGMVEGAPNALGEFLWAYAESQESATKIVDAGRTLAGNLLFGVVRGLWEGLGTLEVQFHDMLNAAMVNAIRGIDINAGPLSFRGTDIFPDAIAAPKLPAIDVAHLANVNPLNMTLPGVISRGVTQGAIAVTVNIIQNLTGEISDQAANKLKRETSEEVVPQVVEAITSALAPGGA